MRNYYKPNGLILITYNRLKGRHLDCRTIYFSGRRSGDGKRSIKLE